MAVPVVRNLVDELRFGAGDGSLKRVAPDRGGIVEATTAEQRQRLDPSWYGMITTASPTERMDPFGMALR